MTCVEASGVLRVERGRERLLGPALRSLPYRVDEELTVCWKSGPGRDDWTSSPGPLPTSASRTVGEAALRVRSNEECQ